jgi:uncharacterized protein (DUF1330 family)
VGRGLQPESAGAGRSARRALHRANTEIEKLEGPAAVSTAASSSSSRRSRAPATGYDSAEYQPQLRARQAGSLGNLILLEGL